MQFNSHERITKKRVNVFLTDQATDRDLYSGRESKGPFIRFGLISLRYVACVTENTTFQYSSLVYGPVCKSMLFQYKGSLVSNQERCHFSAVLRFIFACRLVLYLYACADENPEISGIKCIRIHKTISKRILEKSSSSLLFIARFALLKF